MLKGIWTTGLVVLLTAYLAAQDFDHYKPIQCKGELPVEFYSENALVTTTDVGTIGPGAKYSEIKSKQDFIKYSDFYLRYLLRSGDLMFGDPLTIYVNNVADQLLKDFPDVRSQFRFYVSRYPEVNAACLPNGIVIVNIGLLAQLENEAQLAFVLAHEIVHYIKKHGIDAYIEQNRIRRNVGEYRNIRKSDRLFSLLQYQKDLEFAADEIGFNEYYSKSGYKLSEAEALCDVLLYSDFPVDEIPVSRSLFEDEYLKIPDKCWLDTVSLITAIEDFDDEKMTHPNIKKRRERLMNLLAGYYDAGAEFMLGRDDFFNMREISRFELLQLYLTDRKYVDALYLIHILQKEYPGSTYLNHAKAASYYGLVRLKNERNKTVAIRSSTKIKGESQRLFHMFRNLSNRDLVTICSREIWKAHQADPSDSLLFRMARESMSDLLNNCNIAENYFMFTPPVKMDSTVTTSVSDSTSSKYDKIKQNQKKASMSDPFAYAFLAFADDKEFRRVFNDVSDKSVVEIERTEKKKKSFEFTDSLFAGTSKILFFDPAYVRTSESKKSGERFLASTRYEQRYVQQAIEAAKMAKIDLSLLDVSDMNNGDEDRYNKFQLIQSWINELPEEDESGKSFISTNQDKLNLLADDEGTSYVCLTGLISVRSQREFRLAMVYLLMIPPTYPFLLAYMASPKYETLYYFYLYDIRTGQKVYNEVSLVKSRDYTYTVKNMLYTTMSRLNKSKKQ